MKLLLLGFQPKDAITYPHLEQVTEYLLLHGAEYFSFQERGYFLGSEPTLRKTLKNIFLAAFDACRLGFKRVFYRYDCVVATDNFAFLVAAAFFPRVILWSHDFLTDDDEHRSTPIQRFVFAGVQRGLSKHGRLIIQDPDRLNVFRQAYLKGETPLDVFLLPVSVRAASTLSPSRPRQRPVLLQIGGINASRSHSDALLRNYQENHETYELAFHGYFDERMSEQIANSQKLPWVSSLLLAPRDVGRAVEKCDIGLLAYNASNANFFNIARASGQLAEFLRCGKPIISMGPSNLREMVALEQIGVAITGVDELASAVQDIVANYATYAANSRRLFAETYDLDSYLKDLLKWLEQQALSQ